MLGAMAKLMLAWFHVKYSKDRVMGDVREKAQLLERCQDLEQQLTQQLII